MRNEDILADVALDAANSLSPEGIRRALGDGTTGSRRKTRFEGDNYSADLAIPIHATSVEHGSKMRSLPAVRGRWTLKRIFHHSTFLPGRGEHMGITTTSQQHELNPSNRSQFSVDTQPSNTYLLFHQYYTTTSLTLSYTCIGWTMFQRPSTPARSPWGILGRTICRVSIIFAVAVGIGPTQQAAVIHTGRIWDGAPQEGGPIRLPTIHQVDKKLDVGVWLDRGFTTTGQGMAHAQYDIHYEPLIETLKDISAALDRIKRVYHDEPELVEHIYNSRANISDNVPRGPSTTEVTIHAHETRLRQIYDTVRTWAAMGLNREELRHLHKAEQQRQSEKFPDAFLKGPLGSHLGRQKRSLFAIGALVGAGVAIGFAMYNREQIAKLQNVVEGLEEAQDLIVHEISAVKRKIDHYGSAMRSVQSNVRRLDGMLIHVAVLTDNLNLVEAAISSLETHVMTIDKVIASARRNEVNQNLFEPYAPSELLDGIDEQVADKGHRVLPNSTLELLQCPATGLAHRNGFRVIIHIPTTARDDILRVYEFKAIPRIQTGHLVAVKPEETILAINDARTHYKVFSKAALERCTVLGRFMMCDNNNVAYSVPHAKKECLVDLFLGRPSMNASCPITIGEPKFAVTHIEGGLNILVSPEDTWASLQCGHRTASIQIDDISELHMEPDCKITASFGTIHRALDLNVTGVARTASWDLATSNITGSLDLVSYKHIVEAAKTLDMGPPPTNLNETDAFVAKYNRIRHNRHHQHGTYGGSILIVALVIIIMVILCCMRKQLAHAIGSDQGAGAHVSSTAAPNHVVQVVNNMVEPRINSESTTRNNDRRAAVDAYLAGIGPCPSPKQGS